MKSKQDAVNLLMHVLSKHPEADTDNVRELDNFVRFFREAYDYAENTREDKRLASGKAPKKPTGAQQKDRVMEKLRFSGLRHSGIRSGKAGVFFGVDGGSRALAAARNYLMQNVLVVQLRHGTLDARWSMENQYTYSEATDEVMDELIKWAKGGNSSVDLRRAVRASGNDGDMASGHSEAGQIVVR